MSESTQFDINKVIADARLVLTNPSAYYQNMPKTGGFAEPLIFIVVMAVAMGVISAILSLFSSAGAGFLALGFGAIIILPISVVIGAFIGAAILFVIWKLMGSVESYETAFRCLAAATAIYPIMALLAIIPYLGTIIGIAWASYLLIEASVAVHGRERKTATIVFAIIGGLMIMSNVSSEYAARNLAVQAEKMGAMFEDYQNLPPEEAGRKMGEFLKGIEQGMGKEQ
jgi:hypothetical protein